MGLRRVRVGDTACMCLRVCMQSACVLDKRRQRGCNYAALAHRVEGSCEPCTPRNDLAHPRSQPLRPPALP